MGVSTFCRFGIDKDLKFNDPTSHGRCQHAGIPCDCTCHQPAVANPPNPTSPERGEENPMTTTTDTETADDGMVACPDCEKRVKPGGLGIHRAKAHGVPGSSPRTKHARGVGEAPPDVDEVVADEGLVDDDEEGFELNIIVSRTERDVLDALGFLDGHGDATGHLVHLVSTLCIDAANEEDVQLVLTARHGRTGE